MNRILSSRLALPAAIAVIAIGALALILVAGGGGEPASAERENCAAEVLTPLVSEAPDTNAGVARVVEVEQAERTGYLLGNCHNIMHPVGRAYGKQKQVTFARLMDVLPDSNDPGCAAGFTHGILTFLAPNIDPRNPAKAEREACSQAPTRFQKYSCDHGFGHAFMRLWEGNVEPALRFCARLGRTIAPDCAQGAFHDYWFSTVGKDGLPVRESQKGPADLCKEQREQFVIPCWYRSMIDTRPKGYVTRTPADFARLCAGLEGLQRRGCITAASVIGDANPLKQFRVCTQLPKGDIAPCLDGVKVANLDPESDIDHSNLIRRCDWLKGAQALECFETFGKDLNVLTNGEFETGWCRKIADYRKQSACVRGAERYEEALVTYS